MPGPREPSLTPYMIPFARAVQSGDYRRVVAITSAQAGKTDTKLDINGTRVDQRPAPTIYVAPTKEFLVDQFEPRLMEMLNGTPSLSAKVLRGRVMKKTLKWIGGVRLRLAHSGSPTALKSDPAALAIVDEYDAMLKNVRRQGDPLRLVEARGDTYADFCVVIASTPSLGLVDTEIDPVSGLEFWKVAEGDEIESAVWTAWQEGTRFHWAWPCPHCGEFFIPRRKHLSWPAKATPIEARYAAVLTCPHCGTDINDDAKAAMNAAGVFVAPGQWIKDGKVEGEPPASSTCSFWTAGLASPFKTWGERAEDLVAAQQSRDPDRIQTVINSRFGELYAPGGGETPEWREVLQHRYGYEPGSVPTGVVFLVASIDVQKNRLVYVVRGWGARATSWMIDNGELWGQTTELEVWDQLDELLSSDYLGKPIKLAFIDSGFRPGKPEIVPVNRVYQFCRTHQRFVFPCKGVDVMSAPMARSRIEVSAADGSTAKYGLEQIRLNTDWWKLWVFEHIRWPLDQPGAWYLHDSADEVYAKQITSEARAKSPIGRPVWVQRTRENHYLDCEAMNAAAAYMLGAHRLSGRAHVDTAETARAAAAALSAPPPTAAEAERPKTDDRVSRFRDFAARMNSTARVS